MGIFTLPWSLTAALLASTFLPHLGVVASPAIDVQLKAPFAAAPYLLELLETAAEENATSYFPMLDRVAEGYFERMRSEQNVYNRFMLLLERDGHMTDAEVLSSFKFALATRSAAPRIEAHYQYYHTAVEPSIKSEKESSCPAWVLFNGKQYCSPTLEVAHGIIEDAESQIREHQFDRTLGDNSLPAAILYVDITSELFGHFHRTLVKTAREGKTSYRVRHRVAPDAIKKPLIIPGYGVELALKRTDYIVIDDREASDKSAKTDTEDQKIEFNEDEVSDLKPLSTSELSSLGLKAASYILQSKEPFEALSLLSRDFPRYSSAITSHNVSETFLAEHEANREKLVPEGYNVMWLNGIQMIERNVEALTILDMLRRERRLINGIRELGLTSPEAIELLSHKEVSNAKVENEVQRFDWTDNIEEGGVIIWLNDIEKDTRYEDWPQSLNAFLQRTYPGQLPQVRREAFDLVVPINFADPEDVSLVLDTLISFVKRKLAIRIGLVPLLPDESSLNQTKTVYHLHEAYGLTALTTYLEASVLARKLSTPDQDSFATAIEGRTVRSEKEVLDVAGILGAGVAADQLFLKTIQTRKWLKRLSVDDRAPVFFADGAVFPRDDNWMQSMGQRISADLQILQSAIYQEEIQTNAWLPEHFLATAARKRNALITPEDDKTIRLFDVSKIYAEHGAVLETLPRFTVDSTATDKSDWLHLLVVADFNTPAGSELLSNILTLQERLPIEIIFIHNPLLGKGSGISNNYFHHMRANGNSEHSDTIEVIKILGAEAISLSTEDQNAADKYWHRGSGLVTSLGLQPGQNGLLLNGRLVGPIPKENVFDFDDLIQLVDFERLRRVSPAYTAIEKMGLSDKLVSPLQAAKLSSIVAISTISDTPEGIFDTGPTMRMSQFDIWNTTHTTFEIGDKSSATIQLKALIDPASEQGQRWVPILKVLSKLNGVYLQVFLNPKDGLTELPVKRFYRYVLESEPNFDEFGSVVTPGASFHGVPKEALLTVGLDIPPAWLVAPKESVHDLDNIKLSAVDGDVKALYELEHILIEGHSRENAGGKAPRGAQLSLGTARDPYAADTIIMANLGYFQFKANPGYYKIDLLKGRSAEIFNIDSVGAKGYAPVAGDENTEVVLMSFQGATIYPRLSRKPGMEEEDVLEAKATSKVDDIVSSGLNFAQRILGKNKAVETSEHADINIFSVASGHLYERMLNIMMVSVMKNTKRTVKFWFIEQFLSPSFKEFLPQIAAEYGFKYELVTFKWPHWLRAQTEKQREIWGYKILFLDVLFPLSLSKVIFVDADQIVRTDMMELVNLDLQGAPYGFTPMCDSRTEMEGFRFWKQGYWKNFLRGLPYHISALYVVDLNVFRQIAAGDRLRQQYHSLSADPNSLSNLDQDLPNHMQNVLKIHSLPQEWLWCETWCSDESQKEAKTIDLCNNPQTKEPKLDRARRQVPEWTIYDDEIAGVEKRWKERVKTEKVQEEERLKKLQEEQAKMVMEMDNGEAWPEFGVETETVGAEESTEGSEHVRDEL